MERWKDGKFLAVLKFVEGILIILSAHFLVKLINFRTEEILFEAFAIFLARFLISNFTAKKFFQWSLKVKTYFRKKLHEEILRKEVSSGAVLTLIFDTVQTAEEFFLKVASNIFSVIILLPMFLICAIFTDKITAAILFFTLPVAPFLLYLIGKVTAEKNQRAWAELQKLNGEFKEILSAITALKIFGRIDAAALQLKKTSEKSSAAILDVLKFAFVSSFALELITTLSIALVAVTLGLRLVAGSVEFDAALFLLIIAPEFFLPVRKLGVAFHVVISAKSSLERIKNFLSREEKTFGKVEKLKVPPEIFVENISYTYPRKKNPAISGISLKISAGKITAIVGESGCGKSTLLKLLAGLILPTEGEIFFSELPTSKMQRESLFEKISYAPQSPHLFDSTLIENFSMFNQLDTKNLHELLSALDLKLNLSGVQKLSRGQLQRLGIIRALLKNSSLILLDEPTAGLDEISEKKVLALLKKFSPRKTIVIATHRQTVINFADEIINLEVNA